MNAPNAPQVAADKAMTLSFWGLGLLISAGIVLAYFIW